MTALRDELHDIIEEFKPEYPDGELDTVASCCSKCILIGTKGCPGLEGKSWSVPASTGCNRSYVGHRCESFIPKNWKDLCYIKDWWYDIGPNCH